MRESHPGPAFAALAVATLLACGAGGCRQSAGSYEDGLSSPVASLTRLGNGDVEAVLAPADAVAEAVNGLDEFAGRAVAARTIAVLGTRAMHLVTVPRARIYEIAELRGHLVSTGPAGSSTELTAERILRAAGLDPERDIRRQRLDINASIEALRGGSVDAFFWLAEDPSPDLRAVAQDPATTLRLISTSSVLASLVEQYGRATYLRAEIPQGLYRNVIPIATVGVRSVVVARSDLPDDEAYALARRFAALGAKRPSASGERGGTPDSPAALHPGAARFYDERR